MTRIIQVSSSLLSKASCEWKPSKCLYDLAPRKARNPSSTSTGVYVHLLYPGKVTNDILEQRLKQRSRHSCSSRSTCRPLRCSKTQWRRTLFLKSAYNLFWRNMMAKQHRFDKPWTHVIRFDTACGRNPLASCAVSSCKDCHHISYCISNVSRRMFSWRRRTRQLSTSL